ncbi:MAG: beta-lactamase family protein, partial [bacterium]|nr:beta-lactamase family protein [bacterium]
MKRKAVFVLFMLSILFTFAFQYNLYAGENGKAAKIDELLKRYHDYGYLNGAVLVVDNGNIIYKKAFGLADMELDVPLQIDTKFNIYSCSKQFTAAAVMQLVELGKIKLQGKISDYLPYYPKEVGEKITIHQLLTHTHGIPDPDYNKMPMDISGPAEEVLKTRFSGTPTFAPGSQFRYSGLSGYMILGAIIEKVTGKSFEEVLTEKIFKPLNMKNSTHSDCKKILKGAASAYLRSDQYRVEKWNRSVYPTYCGGSMIYSTVEDMYLWDRALYTDKLLSKKSRDLLFTNHVVRPRVRPKYYGYGWYLDDQAMSGKTRKFALHAGGGSNIICRAVDDNHLV